MFNKSLKFLIYTPRRKSKLQYIHINYNIFLYKSFSKNLNYIVPVQGTKMRACPLSKK